MLENIKIEVTDNNTIVVIADTIRYGKNAIMYEDNKFVRCCDYIRQVTGNNHFKLDGMPSIHGIFTDTDGKTLPRKLFVRFES